MEFQRTTELFNSCAPGEHQIHVAEHLLRLLGDPTARPAPLTRHQGAVLRSILAERRTDPQAWTAHWQALEEEAFG